MPACTPRWERAQTVEMFDRRVARRGPGIVPHVALAVELGEWPRAVLHQGDLGFALGDVD